MLSKKLKRSVLISLIVIAFLVALIGGLWTGYSFIVKQNEGFQRLEQAAQLARKKTKDKKNAAKAVPVLDSNGQPIEPFEPPTEETPGAQMFVINSGDSTSKIAKNLKKQGLISSELLFNIFSKLNGFDGSYQRGTHYLVKNMSFDEMMYTLTQRPKSLSVTFPEGTDYIEMKAILRKNGINFDEQKLDMICNDLNRFVDYSFVQKIPVDGRRACALEGYLFPDTYFFDVNVDEESIVRTMLNNTEEKLRSEYLERAETMGFTMDQMITLASVIEKESAIPREMYLVSRVFHNRLKNDDLLQSCATVNYVRQQSGRPPILLVLNSDLKDTSPYNTYIHGGLPPGPICSPGLESIRAALYPDTENTDIYYFVADGEGNNIFASSLDEQAQNIENYIIPIENEKRQQVGETPISKEEIVQIKPGDEQ